VKNKLRENQDRIFNFVTIVIMAALALVILYPLYFVLVASVSDPYAVAAGEAWLFPKNVTLDGYKRVFSDKTLWKAYYNSFAYMTVGTLINVVVTIPAGYALSRKDLKGRKFILLMMTFTMFFSGGMIPTYLLIQNLHIQNTFWAMVLPNAMIVLNVFICKTFFESNIPDALFEAASIDGCSNFRFFCSMVLPLSKTIIMVMVLFYAVNHWNEYLDALLYLRDSDKYPLQVVLRDILMSNEVGSTSMMINDDSLAKQQRVAELIKYCVIVISNAPLLVLYPAVQKYFKKGVMIGSIKG